MTAPRIFNVLFFFLTLMLLKCYEQKDYPESLSIIQVTLSGFCVGLKLAIHKNQFSDSTALQLITAVKIITLVSLSIYDLNSDQLPFMRNFQCTLFGFELCAIHKYQYKAKNKYFSRRRACLLFLLANVVLFLGQIENFHNSVINWIQFTIIQLTLGYDLARQLVFWYCQQKEVEIGGLGKISTNKRYFASDTEMNKCELKTQGTTKLRSATQKVMDIETINLKKITVDDIVLPILDYQSKRSPVYNQSLHDSCMRMSGQFFPSGDNVEGWRSFYQILFNQFPDGILILAEGDRVQFCNQNIRKLCKAESKDEASRKVLRLKNCQQKFAEQAQFQNLFDMLKKKIQVQKSEKDINMPDDDQHQDSESQHSEDSDQWDDVVDNINIQYSDKDTVMQEYILALKKLQLQQTSNTWNLSPANGNKHYTLQVASSGSSKDLHFQKDSGSPNYHRQKERIRFSYEVKMICFDDEENDLEEMYKKQNSNTSQTKAKLLEVTLKAYIYDSKPYVLILVKDVTLFNQYSVLEQTNSNKSKMLYQVAHEFRTPLSCIILMIETLIEKYQKDNDICQNFFNPMLMSASQLLSLVNDLLDLAQLKVGKFKLSFQEFDLVQTLNAICQILAPSVQSKGLELRLIVDKKMPFKLVSDPNRIRQIVINLISNSIKFTQKGYIQIETKLTDKRSVEISVTDTGVGIQEDDIPSLFRAFGKIEGTSNMNHQGVGLGLMISHILAQKLASKGSQEQQTERGLRVVSQGKGQGCSFSFEIHNHKDEINNLKESESPQKVYKEEITLRDRRISNVSIYLMDIQSQIQVQNKVTTNDKIVYNYQTKYEGSQLQMSRSIKNDPSPINSMKGLNGKDIRKAKLLQMKFGFGATVQFRDEIKQQGIPQISGEKEEDFSPKDIDFIYECKTSPNIYWFKHCSCPEILIVDDQIFNIKVLQLSLKRYSLKIDFAGCCETAMMKLANYRSNGCCQWVKIILMDIELGSVDGLQTTQKIREFEQRLRDDNQQFDPAFIIGLSGYGEEIKDQCISSGMNKFMQKPLDINQFLKEITYLVEKSSKKI